MNSEQAFQECMRLFDEGCRVFMMLMQTDEQSEILSLHKQHQEIRRQHSDMAAQLRLLIEREAATLN